MSRHTTFAIGGPADLFLVANDPTELVEWTGLARQLGVPYTVLGNGSNVLVADAGIRGLVIVNRCRAYSIDPDGMLKAESGVLMRALARRTAKEGWQGIEWAAGIPGTIGGAVVGNAGAFGGCMADIVRSVRVVDPEGTLAELLPSDLGFGYRTSTFKAVRSPSGGPVVLSVSMQLRPGDAHALRQRVEQITSLRRARQPVGRCAGSAFRRTAQYPAGFLIDQAGLKNLRIGDAIVSPKHANFLMNGGSATAADMRALMDRVQEAVFDSFGEQLEPEIEFVGAWSKAPDKDVVGSRSHSEATS
jgi:UDP-N-acetylmuramate dehydrogenase